MIPRGVVFFAMTWLHGVCFLGLYAMIERHGIGRPWRQLLVQSLLNAAVGVVATRMIERGPEWWRRRQYTRTRGRTTAGALSARHDAAMPFAEERLNLPLRLRVLQWSLAAVFLVLATAFWYFQVARHQQFLEMAENNHQRALPLAAPRGVLFDRGGTVLVENRFAFNISIVREQTNDLARTVAMRGRS